MQEAERDGDAAGSDAREPRESVGPGFREFLLREFLLREFLLREFLLREFLLREFLLRGFLLREFLLRARFRFRNQARKLSADRRNPAHAAGGGALPPSAR